MERDRKKGEGRREERKRNKRERNGGKSERWIEECGCIIYNCIHVAYRILPVGNCFA